MNSIRESLLLPEKWIIPESEIREVLDSLSRSNLTIGQACDHTKNLKSGKPSVGDHRLPDKQGIKAELGAALLSLVNLPGKIMVIFKITPQKKSNTKQKPESQSVNTIPVRIFHRMTDRLQSI